MRVRNVRSEPIDASLHLIIGRYDEEESDRAHIYALSCGEKLSPKVHLWRKDNKYEVWRAALKVARTLCESGLRKMRVRDEGFCELSHSILF